MTSMQHMTIDTIFRAPFDYEGDWRIDSVQGNFIERRYQCSVYCSVQNHFLPYGGAPVIREILDKMVRTEQYDLVSKQRRERGFDAAWHYRSSAPAWPTFKSWLSTFYENACEGLNLFQSFFAIQEGRKLGESLANEYVAVYQGILKQLQQPHDTITLREAIAWCEAETSFSFRTYNLSVLYTLIDFKDILHEYQRRFLPASR